MRARLTTAGVLVAGALLVGCQTTVTGDPQPNAGGPAEPSFPTSRTTPPPAPTPTAARPPTAEALPPDNGYVFITTRSGKTRCQISAADVSCEAAFANAPVVDGARANGVRVTAGGQLKWVLGNLGDIPVVTIDYRTYTAVGWTIVAQEDGTRFTNDGTGHGMSVAIQGVEAY